MNATNTTQPNEKTTVYLDPKVKKSVQYYALRDNSSLSQIINDRLAEYLEDQADIATLSERENNAEFVPLSTVLEEFGLNEKDLQNSSRKTRQ